MTVKSPTSSSAEQSILPQESPARSLESDAFPSFEPELRLSSQVSLLTDAGRSSVSDGRVESDGRLSFTPANDLFSRLDSGHEDSQVRQDGIFGRDPLRNFPSLEIASGGKDTAGLLALAEPFASRSGETRVAESQPGTGWRQNWQDAFRRGLERNKRIPSSDQPGRRERETGNSPEPTSQGDVQQGQWRDLFQKGLTKFRQQRPEGDQPQRRESEGPGDSSPEPTRRGGGQGQWKDLFQEGLTRFRQRQPERPRVPTYRERQQERTSPQDSVPEYYEQNPVSLPLSGRTIAIAAGHGGRDSGAVVAGVREKDINLQVVRRLARQLEKLGANVRLTRNSDVYVSPPDIRARYNSFNPDIAIAIHADSVSPSVSGILTLYSKDDSIKLARTLQNALVRQTGAGDRGAKFQDKSWKGKPLQSTRPDAPAVILELGNMRNRVERSKLTNPQYQETLARGISNGIQRYFGKQPGSQTYRVEPRQSTGGRPEERQSWPYAQDDRHLPPEFRDGGWREGWHPRARRQARPDGNRETQRESDRTPERTHQMEGRVFRGRVASIYWEDSVTANGDRFDRNAMTAAHRTLPFGTKVKVTDQSTGRSVVVTINDDGPHVRGRHIDLSLGAARAMGLSRSRGLATVDMEIVKWGDGRRTHHGRTSYMGPGLRNVNRERRRYGRNTPLI